MPYQYKRRRPSIIRNFWVYRRLIGAAALIGLMLWFVWANNTAVRVSLPFRLGGFDSSVGVVILLSAACGSVATILTMTVYSTLRRIRGPQPSSEPPPGKLLDDDRPPPDYASKTEEGFPNSQW